MFLLKKVASVTRISSQISVKTDKIYFTSLHLRSLMNAGAGCVWYLSRCDHEPNTTVPERQNSHQLETSWQRTSGQLCVSAGSESFVSILMATKGGQGDSICSQCTTHNDFHVPHSWQSIKGRKCYAHQSSSHICRDQGHENHSIWSLRSVKGGWIGCSRPNWNHVCNMQHITRQWDQQTTMKTHKDTTYTKLTLTHLDRLVGVHPSAASHQVDMSESRCPPRWSPADTSTG